VGEWIWLMRDLNGPAVVRGVADKDSHQPVEFRGLHSGFTKAVTSNDGAFRVLLPQGEYTVRQGTTRTTLTALSGGTYDVDLRRGKAIDYTATTETEASGDILLRVTARGTGQHTFSIRADNLELREAVQRIVTLSSGNARELIWHAHIISPETPWVTVIVPDHALDHRRELTGTTPLKSAPGN
jgi:glucose/arabinose dehydrogenase